MRRQHDVIIVGGGPGGSVLAWDLARQGVEVLLLERARLPREKVCGDYVEPRGLRILDAMGCLPRLEETHPLPITHSATFVDGQCRYRGAIPFYGQSEELPPHGYIIARESLDHVMLQTAEEAGATVMEETPVMAVVPEGAGVEVQCRRRDMVTRHRGRLVVGADGAHSVVAKSAGLLVEDDRHIAVAQRAYAEGAPDEGEAVFCFDESFFPGYGWAFPMGSGRMNVGVGILSETRRRMDLNLPDLLDRFFTGLRLCDPRFEDLQLCSSPIGGIVKTYGGAGRNVFHRGLLIGDAGSFVDPMTGEGITPAMESALLAAPVLTKALASGNDTIAVLAEYERLFRAHFDPSMTFLDLCAATLRNRYLARPWLAALARGCKLAQSSSSFARSAGSYFGGLDVHPTGILAHVWMAIAWDLATIMPRLLGRGIGGTDASNATTVSDLAAWQGAWWRSLASDPVWHIRWSMDVQRKWVKLLQVLSESDGDPRAVSLV